MGSMTTRISFLFSLVFFPCHPFYYALHIVNGTGIDFRIWDRTMIQWKQGLKCQGCREHLCARFPLQLSLDALRSLGGFQVALYHRLGFLRFPLCKPLE